jgi:hypothetical protein
MTSSEWLLLFNHSYAGLISCLIIMVCNVSSLHSNAYITCSMAISLPKVWIRNLIFRVHAFLERKKQSCHTKRYARGKGERKYSSYSFLTSALDGGEWSALRPGRALPRGKGPLVPIGQEAGWAPEPIWTQRIEEKSFAPAGNRTPIARSSSP